MPKRVAYDERKADRQLDDEIDRIVMSHEYHSGVKAPLYSTYHPAAWGVCERMRALGFSVKIFMPESQIEAVVSFICSRGPCERHGTSTHNHHGAYDVDAPTVELAICRAALIALASGRGTT